MSKKKVDASCENCRQSTHHEVLCESVETGNRDYDFHRSHQVIQCLGCDRKSFRWEFEDRENLYPVNDDEWEYPIEVECYPKFNVDHKVSDRIWFIPDLVREIYQETLVARREGALTLCGLGLRGTIEAICNDRNISGRNLESRINKLATQGLISSANANILHSIRFLGNDAAHEIKKPSKEQIYVAQKIIDHLVDSIYLLPEEVSGKLDTIISDLSELTYVLAPLLREFSVGDEFPLAKFLGKNVRRLGGNADAMEQLLIESIKNKTYGRLDIGKTATFANSKSPVQHFVVR